MNSYFREKRAWQAGIVKVHKRQCITGRNLSLIAASPDGTSPTGFTGQGYER
jgi:hypothetical protein